MPVSIDVLRVTVAPSNLPSTLTFYSVLTISAPISGVLALRGFIDDVPVSPDPIESAPVSDENAGTFENEVSVMTGRVLEQRLLGHSFTFTAELDGTEIASATCSFRTEEEQAKLRRLLLQIGVLGIGVFGLIFFLGRRR